MFSLHKGRIYHCFLYHCNKCKGEQKEKYFIFTHKSNEVLPDVLVMV